MSALNSPVNILPLTRLVILMDIWIVREQIRHL
ncbi:hypothetical protein D910_12377 [Dendroctonus ponderosae]